MNVETTVVAWLSDFVGQDWSVHGDMPDVRPLSFILVDRTGGPRDYMVLDKAEILIKVYHKNSRLDASNKANEIANRIGELRDIENITRAKVNSLVNLDDPIGQYSRYQIYCDIWMRQ